MRCVAGAAGWATGVCLALLGGFLGCNGGNGGSSGGGGGGGTPVLATGLNYTNPVSGTYQLMRNPALSTPSHLVLELVGPAATTGRGVVFSLTVDTAKVSWSNVAPADPPGTYVQNGTAFDLGTGGQVLKGKVNGEELQAVAAQKGAASPSVQLNQPLARIAMDLKPSQNLWAGTPITFTAIPGKSLALLGPAGSPQAIQIAVGSLTAK